MRPFRFLFQWLILPAAVLSSAAAQTDIAVKAQLDRAFITIGDPVEYRVTIRHAPSVEILSSIPPPPSDVFKIKKVEDIRQEDPPYRITGKKYTLTTFRLGEFVLDPVEIRYRKEGQEPQTIQTDKIYLTVKSVAEGELKEDIRGVKPVSNMPGRQGMIILWACLILAALATYAVYRRRRSDGELPVDTGPVMTPEDEAFSLLNQLFDSDLIRQGKYRQYYFHLSEILRNYMERRFHILAVEQTTTEIARSLKGKPVDRKLREKINEVLEAADLAKFAKWRPDPSEIVRLNKQTKEIIELARPAEPQTKERVNGI